MSGQEVGAAWFIWTLEYRRGETLKRDAWSPGAEPCQPVSLASLIQLGQPHFDLAIRALRLAGTEALEALNMTAINGMT